jgi:hypothetical protein
VRDTRLSKLVGQALRWRFVLPIVAIPCSIYLGVLLVLLLAPDPYVAFGLTFDFLVAAVLAAGLFPCRAAALRRSNASGGRGE